MKQRTKGSNSTKSALREVSDTKTPKTQLSLGVLPQLKQPHCQILNINLKGWSQNPSPCITGHLARLVCLVSYVKLISSAATERGVFTEINMDGTNQRQSNCGLFAMARATVKKALTQQVRRVYVATVSKDHHTVT